MAYLRLNPWGSNFTPEQSTAASVDQGDENFDYEKIFSHQRSTWEMEQNPAVYQQHKNNQQKLLQQQQQNRPKINAAEASATSSNPNAVDSYNLTNNYGPKRRI